MIFTDTPSKANPEPGTTPTTIPPTGDYFVPPKLVFFFLSSWVIFVSSQFPRPQHLQRQHQQSLRFRHPILSFFIAIIFPPSRMAGTVILRVGRLRRATDVFGTTLLEEKFSGSRPWEATILRLSMSLQFVTTNNLSRVQIMTTHLEV